jgi:hypothetical protein
MPFPHTSREWLTFAESGALRIAMAIVGLLMMILGLALGVSMVMLPVGLVVGLAGVCLFVWAVVGDLPIAKP